MFIATPVKVLRRPLESAQEAVAWLQQISSAPYARLSGRLITRDAVWAFKNRTRGEEI